MAGSKFSTVTSGTSHVWLHEANRGVMYAPFENLADSQAYDGYCLTSPVVSGDTAKADSGFLRIDTETQGNQVTPTR